MMVFIDTSAFLAILDADDKYHKKASEKWAEFISSEETLFCNNYILVETFALVQNRLGMEALRTFNDDILPLVNIDWVEESTHKAGVSALLTASRKRLSMVDCVSFETMRRLEIMKVFTFDLHFTEQGFQCIP